jgi:hypothetical protein
VGEGDTVLAQLRLPFSPEFDVSPDGSLLVYTSGHATYALWTLERDRQGRPWRTRRVTTSTTALFGPVLANDGEQVVYGAVEPQGEGTQARVYVAPFEGGAAKPVGPAFMRLEGLGVPGRMGDTIGVGYADSSGPDRRALISLAGGPPRPMPPGAFAVAGLRDGARVYLLEDETNPATVLLETRGADGRRLHLRKWPEKLGELMMWANNGSGYMIPMVSRVLVEGERQVKWSEYDPIADSIAIVRDLGPQGTSCCVVAIDDGRLGVPYMPSYYGRSTNLLLRLLSRAGKRDEVEELPLPFRSITLTGNLRRAAGLVVSSPSDIWIVRDFDTTR